MSTSRKYAKFKRLFVGPIIPKKIRKDRGIGVAPPMPASKPPKASGPKSNYDFRSCRFGRYLKHVITPSWANKDAIKQIYKEAKQLTAQTGILYEVDHIIPIRGELVCGLHVESNLRIIEWFDNNQKSNILTTH
jgi:hypothetical protein